MAEDHEMPQSSDRRTVGTGSRIGVAAMLWLLLFFGLLVIGPRQKRIFDDFQMQLPTTTMMASDIGMWFADYWWICVPAFFVAFALSAVIAYFIRRRGG